MSKRIMWHMEIDGFVRFVFVIRQGLRLWRRENQIIRRVSYIARVIRNT